MSSSSATPSDLGTILQVVTDTDRRGAQVFATDLHGALVDRGHDVRTVALAASGAERALDLPTLGPSRRHVQTLRALRREMAAASITIAHGSTTLPACAVAGFGLSTPFVYRQISDSKFWADTRLRRARVRLALSRAARVAALWPGSAGVLQSWLGMDRSKIDVVPNGVPRERFPLATGDARASSRDRFGIGRETTVLLYVGALVEEKGVAVAIRALEHLDGHHLLVVGDGPEREALAELTHACAPARVTFAGRLDETWDAYAAADVLVLPSLGGDSMPAVLIEAAFCGVPAVSTPVDGIPAVVVDGKTGRLAVKGDEIALAAAVDDVLAEHERYASAALAHCESHFEISVVAEAWEQTLVAVLAG